MTEVRACSVLPTLPQKSLLAVIGTKECKADLEASCKDSNGLVAMKAKMALDAVATRP